MEYTAFSGESSAAFRLDPRTKLVLVLAVNLIMISAGLTGTAAIIRTVMSVVPFLLLISEGKRKIALIYGIAVAISLFCEAFLVMRTTGIINLLIVIACGMTTRLFPGILTGYYFVSSTKISELVAAMERMHLPQKIIIPFTVMVRFFPTVKEESGAISDAMRMRGVRLGGGNFGAALEYRIVPLLMSTVKIGEELSAAALTRGLGAPIQRTNIADIGFKAVDIIIIILSACGLGIWLFL